MIMSLQKTIHIPVCYVSDENYAKPLTVSMFSVLANTSHHIDFYILENQIRSSTKKKMRKSLGVFNNFTLTFIPVDAGGVVKKFPVHGHFTVSNYLRYFLPELCPNLGKCIYLDVDTIIKYDIYDLFSTDLDGYSVGAVGEETVAKKPYIQERYKALNLSSEHIYFCSGIMLLDLDKWRVQDMTNRLIKLTQEKSDLLFYADQDVFNIMFDKNNYKPLELDWGREIWQLSIDVETDKYLVYSCKLIHYDGMDKPWNKSCWFDSYFWHYAKETLFYKKPSRWRMFWSYLRYRIFGEKYKQEYQRNQTVLDAYRK